MRKLPTLAAAVAVLAGCAGAATITGESYSALYQPELTRYVARDGVMPTLLHGYRLGGEADVLARLTMPGGHPAASFAATDTARQGRGGRLVLVFDPAAPIPGGEAACRLPQGGASAGTPSGEGRLRVLGSFCYGSEAASEAVLTIGRPADAAALAPALNQLVARLLRVDDPNRSSGCGAPC